jgi:hypothetical protein
MKYVLRIFNEIALLLAIELQAEYVVIQCKVTSAYSFFLLLSYHRLQIQIGGVSSYLLG